MVNLKRTSTATLEPLPAEKPEKDDGELEFAEAVQHFHRPDDVKPEEKRKLQPIAEKQLAEFRSEAITVIQRLGKGAAKWAEKGWEWEEPDWDEPPESWPPVAKILYLLTVVEVLREKTSMHRWYTAWPEWCPDCHRDEKRPKGHQQTHCLEHWPIVRRVRAYAANFFAVDFPGEFEEGRPPL